MPDTQMDLSKSALTGTLADIFPIKSGAAKPMSVFDQALQMALVFGGAASLGLCFFSRDIVTLLFLHGHFTQSDVNITAQILALYGAGVLAIVFNKILVQVFYAYEQVFLTAAVAVGSMLLQAALLPWAAKNYGVEGLAALQTSLAFACTGLYLGVLRSKDRVGPFARAQMRPGLSFLLGGFLMWAVSRIPGLELSRVSTVSALMLAGLAYLAVALILNRQMFRQICDFIPRSLTRKRSGVGR